MRVWHDVLLGSPNSTRCARSQASTATTEANPLPSDLGVRRATPRHHLLRREMYGNNMEIKRNINWHVILDGHSSGKKTEWKVWHKSLSNISPPTKRMWNILKACQHFLCISRLPVSAMGLEGCHIVLLVFDSFSTWKIMKAFPIHHHFWPTAECLTSGSLPIWNLWHLMF